MKMPKELKAKWLAALRSGKYKQATGVLCDKAGGYCCLGVLEMVADGEVERHESSFMMGAALSMPTDNFWERNGVTDWYVYSSELAQMNDDGDLFSEIAADIEENVEEL